MKYSRLKKDQRAAVDRAILLSFVEAAKDANLGRGYEAVSWPTDRQRKPSVVELTGEDGILGDRGRLRVTNLHRDSLRNNPTRVTQDEQLRVNVVGTIGGKLWANFPASHSTAATEVMHFFNSVWSPHAEFTFRHHFNWALQTAITAADANGNVLLVFDDGVLTGGNGCGKIRGFEGDEIASVPDEYLERYFPGQSVTQRAGFVYDASGRFIGCFASTSQRGRETFDPRDGVMVFRRDPASFNPQENWVIIGDERRFNQGRAISPITAAIACLTDLHEIVASETQSAKINSQLVAQILRNEEAAPAIPPALLDPQINPEVKLPPTVEISYRDLSAIGARVNDMPANRRIELLDTKRPNPNMEAYIDFLTGLVGGTRGLARVYATLRAQTSYTAFRGEQVMTWPSFEQRQKYLEREVCDPLARLAIRWGAANGYISSALPDGWESMLSWVWPVMREVNEVDAQQAIRLKLENGLISRRRLLPPGEYDQITRELLDERKDHPLIITGGTTYDGDAEKSKQEKN